MLCKYAKLVVPIWWGLSVAFLCYQAAFFQKDGESILATLHFILTIGFIKLAIQEIKEARQKLELLRASPRLGTIWTKRLPIL